jgi:hypothetical protein
VFLPYPGHGSPVLGIITLVAIILFELKSCAGPEKDGMERIIAYPLMLRAPGSGALLMAPEK